MILPFGGLLGAPVVTGYERLVSSESSAVFRGEILLSELNCLSCHTPNETVASRIGTKQAPDLSLIGQRVTPSFLRSYLKDPHSHKPGTTMPDIFHASEARSKEGAIDFLVHYLGSLGGGIVLNGQVGSANQMEAGRQLFHGIGCVACHAPDDSESIVTPIVPLGQLAAKYTVDSLTHFLIDPLQARHSGRMPSFRLPSNEARSLAVYLLRDQLDADSTEVIETPGVLYEYFELQNAERLPDFTTLTPVHSGVVDSFQLELPQPRRDQNFGIRYRGLLEVPMAGEFRFVTRSDDGSKLFVDGELVVDNDGVHAMEFRMGLVTLSPGKVAIEVQYAQDAGEMGLQVLWSGPGIEGRRGRPIPRESLWAMDGSKPMIPLQTETFQLDPQKILMGRRMFSALRCVSCHEMDAMRPMVPAKPLAALSLESVDGCLSGSIRRGLPDYGLSESQRHDLLSALKDRSQLAEPQDDATLIQRTLATFNCYACHERGGIGGPDDRRAEWFQTIGEIDLGEEGKIPPSLNHIGGKLRLEALRKILSDDTLHVRHYMATRMPSFGEENLTPFAEAVHRLDAYSDGNVEAEFSDSQWKLGHRLVGLQGLSCVTCHNISGQKGVGIQGIDLASVYQRVTPGWFRRFLLHPSSFNEDTRMPSFWPEGVSPFPDLAEGNARRQIEGIWSYLSLEESMPLPFGITPQGDVGMELLPAEEPIVHRTFMEGVGARTIVAGFPEKLNVAFDGNVVRLAKVWRGRFFDASGVASARTDRFLGPLGTDVLDMPGPTFARLDTPEAAWPVFDPMEMSSRHVGGEFHGYRLDARRRPTFRYRFDGIEIEETPEPWVQPGGTVLVRKFDLKGSADNAEVYFLAWRGERIEETMPFVYRVDDTITVELVIPPSVNPIVRGSDGKQELLVPLRVNEEGLEFEQIIRW